MTSRNSEGNASAVLYDYQAVGSRSKSDSGPQTLLLQTISAGTPARSRLHWLRSAGLADRGAWVQAHSELPLPLLLLGGCREIVMGRLTRPISISRAFVGSGILQKMISIKRFLDQRQASTAPEHDLTDALSQMGRLLLDAMATHVVPGNNADRNVFRQTLHGPGCKNGWAAIRDECTGHLQRCR